MLIFVVMKNSNYVVTEQRYCIYKFKMEHQQNLEQDDSGDFGETVLECAEEFMSRQMYDCALANYLLAINLKSDVRHQVKDNFVFAFKEWAIKLEQENRLSDLFKIFEASCRVFPDCEGMLNNIGAQLFRLGYMVEGAACVRKALAINPDFIAAQENIDNICSHLVERWHFRMLNDLTRNQAFYSAIGLAISDGFDQVLDIGTGTGIFSMFSVVLGAQRVAACDSSPVMMSIASDVLRANGMSSRVSLLPQHSTDLKQSHFERVSLVITETVDAAIFGENILSTIIDAWTNLLTEPHRATVIPGRATLYVCGIKADSIQRENRFLYPCIQDIDMSSVYLVSSTGCSSSDPYTTENLSSIHQSFSYLTDPHPFLTVDFNNVKMLRELSSGYEQHFMLPVIKGGRLDALAVWFDLHLYGDISLSSSPGVPNCWEQAIFPAIPNCGEDSLKTSVVTIGQSINVVCTLNNDKLSLQCHSITVNDTHSPANTVINNEMFPMNNTTVHSHVRRCSDVDESLQSLTISSDCHKNLLPSSNTTQIVTETDNTNENSSEIFRHSSNYSQALDDSNLKEINMDHDNLPHKVFHFDREDIRRLNDFALYSTYYKALKMIFSQLTSLREEIHLIDLTNSIPLLSLQALKIGYNSCTSLSLSEENAECILYVAVKNFINSQRIKFISNRNEVGNTANKYDVFIMDVIESCGVLRQQILEDIALFRVTSLKEGGIVLPERVKVYGICIESRQLESMSRVVNDGVTNGFKVAEFINHFQTSTFVNIDLTTLKHCKLTEPFLLFDISLNSDPELGELPSYLSLERENLVQVTESGQFTAVVYWFDILLVKGLEIHTCDPSTHWKQAAVIMPPGKRLYCDTKVIIKSRLTNSFINISMGDVISDESTSSISDVSH